MNKPFLIFLVLLFLLIIPGATFAYSSNICTVGDTCAVSEVGIFMEGISLACGNTGDCTLNDIMLVFVNTGNYVVGLIGGIVLLMYIVGGVYFLTSAGNQERVTKGKKFLTTSTIGLLIVMFSYIGIYALRGALQYGTLDVTGDMQVCVDTSSEGQSCGLNMTCTADGLCLSLCEQQHPDATSTSTNATTSLVTEFRCINKNDYPTSFSGTFSSNTGGVWYTSCTANLCPDPSTDVQCCETNYYEWSTD